MKQRKQSVPRVVSQILSVISASLLIFLNACFQKGGPAAAAQSASAILNSRQKAPPTLPSPSTLTYAQPTAAYSIHQAIASNALTVSSEAVTTYVISPPLPVGLSLDSSTGTITGTPTTIQEAALYTVTATHAGKSTTASLIIKVYDCPAGYVLVPPLSPYTTSDFCVAKYIASGTAGGGESVAGAVPWTASTTQGGNITQTAAITACTANGTGYDLITNNEWQTVARNIEGVAANWSGGTVGSGNLNRGHSDSIPQQAHAYAASATDANACMTSLSANQPCTPGDITKRTFRLNNDDPSNQIVWDFAGNVWEWVKDVATASAQVGAFFYTITDLTHPNTFTLQIGAQTSITGPIKTVFGPAGTYTSTPDGLGSANTASISSGTGNVMRGGAYSSGNNAGVFAVQILSSASTYTVTSTGFRCVYHPDPENLPANADANLAE